MISDGNRIKQAENVCRQIRQLGRSERICILLLDSSSQLQHSCLSQLGVEIKVADSPFWSESTPRTGLKLWLPAFFHADSYLLLDSDLIILSANLFDAFKPVHGRLKLVKESFLVWQEGKKGISQEQHRRIIGKPILQTGVMSFDHIFWQNQFEALFNRIQNDQSEFGDMVAVNLFMADNPQFLEPLPEETCLVLRPTGDGPSTRVHIRQITVIGDQILYGGKAILSIHYTYSKGEVHTYADILKLLMEYED